MADNKMLIDAAHPEETRVVVLREGRVEEFDYESAARKLLRGNIYLAKVTRVEPALQAAFVEYGGNRHGFLAFNEIHPDYYQIPVADRIALIEEEAAAEAAEEAAVDALAEQRESEGAGDHSDPDLDEDDGAFHGALSETEDDEQEDGALDESSSNSDDEGAQTDAAPDLEGSTSDEEGISEHDDGDGVDTSDESAGAGDAGEARSVEQRAERDDSLSEMLESDDDRDGHDQVGSGSDSEDGEFEDRNSDDGDGEDELGENSQNGEAERVEEIGTADALEEVPYRPRRMRRSYKIQEVIKRRQVLLVQVVKEERGNKGAALTTYLSLAGRYTVLMPNTARGGGISRKIANPPDRKRMKAIADGLDVPEGMGLIIRTAGASRTKQEIRRDFEYLLRLWESVRQLTFESSAPNLVYEEGNLIKRSIRDLYNKEVEEVVVAGDHAHKEAKSFMRMLMPSHARNVTVYKDPEPLFTKYQIERQLNAMFSPHVPLRSGGYLVINQTEALVAVDVNSGRSTREFSIEETALHTNLEAADEIARQLKLRDLAGLIVIDFIDMEERRNNRSVERRIKDVLRNDRARVQVGRISHFGLLEMSRQRMRTGVLEGSTSQCQHCQGTGIIRSTESVALAVLRALEDAVMGEARAPLVAQTTASVALYILNHKREFINDMHARHGYPITVTDSDKMTGAAFAIEKGQAPAQSRPVRVSKNAVNMDWGFSDDRPAGDKAETEDDEGARKRRRRRRGGRRSERADNGERHAAGEFRETRGARDDDGRGRPRRNGSVDDEIGSDPERASKPMSEQNEGTGDETGDGEGAVRRGRRRGRRGGRRNRERRPSERQYDDNVGEAGVSDDSSIPGRGPQPSVAMSENQSEQSDVAGEGSFDRHKAEPGVVDVLDRGSDAESDRTETAASVETVNSDSADVERTEPQIERIVVTTDNSIAAESDNDDEADLGGDGENKSSRKGWWQRRSSRSE